MFKEYDVVLANRNLSEIVKRGTKGVIMLVVHRQPNKYEVEFVNKNGETLELLTVGELDLELVK